MKKIILGMAVVLSLTNYSLSAEQHASNSFSKDQLNQIEKVVADYLRQHPEIVMTSLQAAMAKEQQAANEKIQKAVAKNKDSIFKDGKSPVIGNVSADKTLVVFTDPYCGYCRKFNGELDKIIDKNKNLKVVFKDVPFSGEDARLAIEAMLAANLQGKHQQLQQAIYSSDQALDKAQILKIATSLGIDVQKLENDMQSKAIKKQIAQTLELARTIGITATPMIITSESTVIPGYVSAEELQKTLDGA